MGIIPERTWWEHQRGRRGRWRQAGQMEKVTTLRFQLLAREQRHPLQLPWLVWGRVAGSGPEAENVWRRRQREWSSWGKEERRNGWELVMILKMESEGRGRWRLKPFSSTVWVCFVFVNFGIPILCLSATLTPLFQTFFFFFSIYLFK